MKTSLLKNNLIFPEILLESSQHQQLQINFYSFTGKEFLLIEGRLLVKPNDSLKGYHAKSFEEDACDTNNMLDNASARHKTIFISP